MNVLFLTQRLPYAPNRGDRIRAYYLLREMSRFANVTLFSLVHDDDEASRVQAVPFAHRVRVARVHKLRNLVRGALSLPTGRPLTHALLDSPQVASELQQAVRDAPPDVVVALCSSMARFAVSPPLSGIPFVVDMIDVDSLKWAELARAVHPPMRWIYRREAATLRPFEGLVTRAAETTLVINSREREALLNIEPSGRVQVIESGVDLDAFRPAGPPEPTATVVFCGVLNYAPNRDGIRWFTHQVWPIVRASRPTAKLLIVGANPPPEILALGRQDPSIEIAGSVPEVQPYLWRSSVAIAPLQVARGIQNKVLEALAAGLPTVVTPEVLGGLPDEAQSGCLVARDPSEFAAAVLRLLALSPHERRDLANQASIEGLTWTHRLKAMEGILRSAQGRREAS